MAPFSTTESLYPPVVPEQWDVPRPHLSTDRMDPGPALLFSLLVVSVLKFAGFWPHVNVRPLYTSGLERDVAHFTYVHQVQVTLPKRAAPV